MQTKLFPLFDDTKDVLRITHDADFQHCTVEVNDHEIAAINDKTALQQGATYDLGGGNRLHIQLCKKYFVATQLQVLVNDEAVEGSDTYPETEFKWVMAAAFLPFLIHFQDRFYTLFYYLSDFGSAGSTLSFISIIENTFLFLATIAALWVLYYYRSVWALYIIIGIYTIQICVQLLNVQIAITNSLTNSTSSVLLILFNLLLLILPTLYLVKDGLQIVKGLKIPEKHSDNANILDSK
jgi:hypothetical protein